MLCIYQQSARSSGDGGQAGLINIITGQGKLLGGLLLISLSLATTGTYADSKAPLVKQLETYDAHSCALFRTGEVSCWGRGEGLGNGSLDNSSVPVPVAAINDTNSRLTGVKTLASGPSSRFTCALLDSSQVACWGSNERGQLGNINTTEVDAEGLPVSTTPVMVRDITGSGYLRGVTHVSVTLDSACALLQGGRVACWGSNSRGTLGSDEDSEMFTTDLFSVPFSSTPLLVKDTSGSGKLRGVRQLASSGNYNCAILRNRQVACWGTSFFNSLGVPIPNFRFTTTPVIAHPDDKTVTRVKQIVAGNASSCVLSIVGTVDCWGGNFFSSLGDGTTIPSDTPVAVKRIGGGNGRLRGVKRLFSGGGANVCAELKRNKVACWGFNQNGALGNGTTENSAVPVSPLGINGLGTLRNLKEIKPGTFRHTCALQKPNQVLCWGNNEFGELGDGTTEPSLLPMPVTNLH